MNVDPGDGPASSDAAETAATDDMDESEFKRFMQESATETVLSLEAAFRAGDRFALFEAISECATYDLALPEWAAVAFLEGYYSIIHFRSASLDDAFGKPHRKGTHLGQARIRLLARFRVSRAVRRILATEPDTPIDDALFERVGRECNVGKTLANQLYYERKRYNETLARLLAES